MLLTITTFNREEVSVRTIFVSLESGFKVLLPSVKDMAWVGPIFTLCPDGGVSMLPCPRTDGVWDLPEIANIKYRYTICFDVLVPDETDVGFLTYVLQALTDGGCYVIDGSSEKEQDPTDDSYVKIELH